MMRVRAGLVVLLGALAVGGSAAAGGGSLGRAFHLPHVARGASCPVSPGRLLRFGPAATPMAMTTAAPAHLMSVGGAGAGVVDVSQSLRDADGYVGQKAPWIVDAGYRGPLLIRGARLDRPGPVRFAEGTGQHLAALYLRRGDRVEPSGRRTLPSLLLVRAPGCYALQVDGLTFSQTVVIRVRR